MSESFADESMVRRPTKFGMKELTLHRSQEVLKMLSLYTYTFLASAEEVLIYPLNKRAALLALDFETPVC
jgi:hypothetical protein